MSNKSIHYLLASATLLAPAVHNAAQTSASFDRELGGGIGAPYEALELLLDVGLWTDGAHSWTVQDSPDNVTWTPVPAANLIGAGAANGGFNAVSSAVGQNATQRCAYVGTQRYVRVVSAEAGTTGLVSGILALPGFPRNIPTVASGQ